MQMIVYIFLPIAMNTACKQRIEPTRTRCPLDVMALESHKHDGKAENL